MLAGFIGMIGLRIPLLTFVKFNKVVLVRILCYDGNKLANAISKRKECIMSESVFAAANAARNTENVIIDPVLQERFTELVNTEYTSMHQKDIITVNQTFVKFISTPENGAAWNEAIFRLIWQEQERSDDNENENPATFFMGYYSMSMVKTENAVLTPYMVSELDAIIRSGFRIRSFKAKNGLWIHDERYMGQ